MPPVDHPSPPGAGTRATKGGKNTNKKKFDPDSELSGAVGCLTPAFFLHLAGTALVLTPLSWGGAGALLSGIATVVVFVATIGPDFHKFQAGTRAYANAHRMAMTLALYGLVTFAASLVVLAMRDGIGALWNALFSAAVMFLGLVVRGHLVGARRLVPPVAAGILTVVIPLLLVADALAFMTYPGVANAALILSLAAIVFWLICTACNRFRTPARLVALLTIAQLVFLPINNHQRSASLVWLTLTGEKETCRLLKGPQTRTFDRYHDDYDYYLCSREVLTVDRREGRLPDTRPGHEVMVHDRTRWSTALLRPEDMKASTAAPWLVNLGVIVVLLGAVLVIAVARRGTPDPRPRQRS